MSVYENVKDLCNKMGISMLKMETAIGVSPGASSKWRKSTPSADAIIKMADYFNVSTDVILGYEAIEKNNSIVADATLKMIYNPELTSVVDKVAKLNEKQLVALKALLDAFLD